MPVVKIVNPDWPDDYIIIDAADFDAARDRSWPEGKVPWEKGKDKPAGYLSYEPEPPPAPEPEHKWQPVATLREAKPKPEPPPEPDRRAAAETMAQTRILDLGPEIAKLRDVALLHELEAIETRSTVKRLVAVRLKELGG
jgi:hypothetical protein